MAELLLGPDGYTAPKFGFRFALACGVVICVPCLCLCRIPEAWLEEAAVSRGDLFDKIFSAYLSRNQLSRPLASRCILLSLRYGLTAPVIAILKHPVVSQVLFAFSASASVRNCVLCVGTAQ